MIHRGKIVKSIVQKSTCSFSQLAKNLHISRNTLYNRLEESKLSYNFILQIGQIVGYNFSTIFPEMNQFLKIKNGNPPTAWMRTGEPNILWELEGKYTKLLEKYNKLISILIKIANRNGMHQFKHELIGMIDMIHLTEKADKGEF